MPIILRRHAQLFLIGVVVHATVFALACWDLRDTDPLSPWLAPALFLLAAVGAGVAAFTWDARWLTASLVGLTCAYAERGLAIPLSVVQGTTELDDSRAYLAGAGYPFFIALAAGVYLRVLMPLARRR